MRSLPRAALVLAAAIALSGCQRVSGKEAAPAPLAFRIDEGDKANLFLRDGKVAAHLIARSGTRPRIIVAFPAGNSGVGLWFRTSVRPVPISVDAPLRTRVDSRLNGIEADLSVRAATVDIEGTVLSSIRLLRDYDLLHEAPPEIGTTPRVAGNTISWARERLDGAPGYRLSLTVGPGRIVRTGDGAIRLVAGQDGRIGLRLVALTGERPLMPVEAIAGRPPDDPAGRRARDVLAFLAYREKFLAGSWRFDTYFGRDTMLSLRMLMPVLSPEVAEIGIASVLARLSGEGEVAHEEDIGEFAVLRHMRAGEGRTDAPIYDYGMVDDDFLLAPVAAHYLLDTPSGRKRAAAFLASKAEGVAMGYRLVANFRWVVRRTAGFAHSPDWRNLVGIKPGRNTGNWRDSEDGLGGGAYPYDINAVLVPSALDAIARLHETGLLAPYEAGAALDQAGDAARIWNTHAPTLFRHDLPLDVAQQGLRDYARQIGVTPVMISGPVSFDALALNSDGRPVPILHSDGGFALLFGSPDAGAIGRVLDLVERRFPAGLMTDAGMLVSNPVFAPPALRAKFGPTAYHGTVVWSWQQAMMLAGLARQAARPDLTPRLRQRLARAHAALSSLAEREKSLRSSELWSWRWRNGRFVASPFGNAGDADESNTAQLWSTVFLAKP